MKDSLIVKISFAFFFPMMLIALVISLTGFRGPIQLDDTFMSFLRRVSFESESWNIAIPNIPKIPLVDQLPYFVADWKNFVNFFVNLVNAVITVGNWAINFMNLIIDLFTFFVALIKLLFDFRYYNYADAGPLTWWVQIY